MRIIGCDLHARQQTLAMLDTATGLHPLMNGWADEVRLLANESDHSGGLCACTGASAECLRTSRTIASARVPEQFSLSSRFQGEAAILEQPRTAGDAQAAGPT
jgi:hypothetical protein